MSTMAPPVPVAVSHHLAETLGSDTLDRVARAWSADPIGSPAPAAIGPSDVVRVGVDLVPVVEVAAAVERLGRRYLHRVFTAHERACARSGPGTATRYSAERLAARFAAKEAAVKVLRPVGVRPEWRSIEVRRVEGGWVELRLSGLAAALAAEAGITALAVSLTHEPMMAAACVVGMRTGGAPAWSRTPSPDRRGK